MFNPFRNVVLNMQATGPAAVICVLFICVAVVAIFGSGPIADKAMNILMVAVFSLVTAFATRPPT